MSACVLRDLPQQSLPNSFPAIIGKAVLAIIRRYTMPARSTLWTACREEHTLSKRIGL